MRRTESTLRECRQRVLAAGAPAVVAGGGDSGDALLMDREGRLHGVHAPRVILGRDSAQVDVAMFHDSVSRRHAELRRGSDGWTVHDLGSTNGTFVEGQRVVGEQAIGDRQLLLLGNVGLLFLTGEPRAARPAEASLTGALIIGRTGIVLDGVELPLGLAEVTALRVLGERARAEVGHAEPTRGFVRSIELALAMSATGGLPPAASMRTLLSRLRRELRRVGGEELLEASDRLGYRLRVVPELRD
jgi:hypothetical protein